MSSEDTIECGLCNMGMRYDDGPIGDLHSNDGGKWVLCPLCQHNVERVVGCEFISEGISETPTAHLDGKQTERLYAAIRAWEV